MASTSGRGEQERDPFLVLEPPTKKIKSALTAKQFDVFINHRGPDIRATLARHLYDSLQQAGIRVYLNSPPIELGDYFPSAIKNAIFSATVHIAILTPRYVESAWCLAELALMFRTKARIIPIFYNVESSDFRHIEGSVAEAFRKHEEKGRYYSHDIQQWKDCLGNVASLKGYELGRQNDDLSKLCNDIVSAVVKEKLKRTNSLQVAKYALGLDEISKDFYYFCQINGKMRDKVVGIYGMGGSGKTTLAKYLFNRKQTEFSASTVLFDLRENHVKGALTLLQSKLLHDLFSENRISFSNIEEGTAIIKDKLENSIESSFLIVLDDVDHQQQLDALLPTDALNPNSLVIVTTRDERLLIRAGVRVRFKMKQMNREHSRLLFCWHAFHRSSCKTGFEYLVDSFVEACGGLPLALQVMGAHVCGGDKNYWRLQLDHFRETQHKRITDRLKISYDALDEDEKEIFMDIACFFLGEDVSNAISIWRASGWRAEHALQTLKDKSLVQLQRCFHREDPGIICKYEPKFIFTMSDHLRNLGREMADTVMDHPSRLWRPEDINGMAEIEGFKDILKRSEGKRFRCYSSIEDSESNLHMTYFLESSATSTDLRWLQLQYKIPEWLPLQNLHTLKLDRASPVTLWQRVDQVPLKLKELCCCFEASGFIEDTSLGDINEVVSSFGMLKNLESLQLNFGTEIFPWSIEWNRLLNSVRQLTSLKTLELLYFQMDGEFDLSNSGETTDDLFCVLSLEAITLCCAFKTTRVSVRKQFCPRLKSLKLCSMEDLIEVDLTGVTTLECLVLLRCKQLRKVLSNDLLKVKMFRLILCPFVRKLPNFGRASCLKRIYISRCRNLQDISAIKKLKVLKRIWIAHCPELKSLKAIEQLKRLKRIWIHKCTKLQGAVYFQELKGLKRIFFGGCTRLESIEGFEFLMSLESIVITACRKLHSIRGIEELGGLKEMIIADSPSISCFERLQRLPGELTIILSRSAMIDVISLEDGIKTSAVSELTAIQIGDTLSMADFWKEIDCDRDGPHGWTHVEEQVKEMVRTTQHSLGTFIFWAMVDGSPGIASGFCDGSRVLDDMDLGPKPTNRSRAIKQRRIYTCVVNEERLSNYDSWMPSSHMWSDCSVKRAFLMGVMKGEERKSLHILQSLSAQLCLGNYEFYKDARKEDAWNTDDDDSADEEEEFDDSADEEEEFDGGDDGLADIDEESDDSDGDFADEYSEDEKSDGGEDALLVASATPFRRKEEERDPILVPEPPNKNIRSFLTAEQFDVFISHQFQNSLSGHLYLKLKQSGIRAYLDSPETKRPPPAIQKAMFSARVHIVIFSPRYAESASCLAQLALMFRTKVKITPLFYYVQPSDFRYIENDVADAFSEHEKKGRYSNQVIQQWKEWLQNVSGIEGYEFNAQNNDEDQLCKQILADVKKELENPKVGLDELVEDLERHYQLKRGLNDKIIGIYGMGGSGKTTLAEDLFNRLRSKYARSCALLGVRERDLTSLQTKLLNDLFYQNLRKFSTTEEGIRYIKRCLEASSIPSFLLLIDDVDQKTQIDSLLSIDALNPNSLVIITTRDERLLKDAGICIRYKIKLLDQQHSRQLFCWHAFHKPDHETRYKDLVECFVKECGGLPLSLQVLGRRVSGCSKVDEVGKRLDGEIKNRLQISYDSLKNDEKQIFIDIACFFVEKDQSIAMRIWKASEWEVEDALQILRDRCLIEVIKQDCWNEITDEDSPVFIFRMHNHLQQLGREMANQGENLLGLRILEPGNMESKSFKDIFAKAQEKRHRCFNSICDESISDKSITYFIGKSATSTTLQWLELNGSESIPRWIPLKELEGLRIRGRLPRNLFRDTPLRLKELVCNFTNCGWMEKATLLRNWNELSNSLRMLSELESLVLHVESQENRKDIVIEWNSFIESVRKLSCLKTLSLSGLYINKEITISPSSEATDPKLEAITLSHVGDTYEISISSPSLKSLKLKHMEDLTKVNLSEVEKLECLELIQCDSLTEVLVDSLPKLEILSVERCSELKDLPNLSYSQWLQRIKITCCEELKAIPGIDKLHWVESVTITCCPELKNVEGFKYLKGLKYMILSDCGMPSCVIELQELPSEFTILMGRSVRSFPEAVEMAGIIGVLNEFQEYSSESIGVTGRAGSSSPKADEMTDIPDASNEPQESSSQSTVLTGKTATSSPRGVEMTDIANPSHNFEEFSSESTFVTSRAATSISEADEKSAFADAEIKFQLRIPDHDALIEFHSEEEAYNKLRLLSQKKPQSLSAIILCAMVDGEDDGSKYMAEGRSSQTIDLSWAGGKWIYTIAVTNRKQIYSAKDFSWMPTSCEIESGYIVPVNKDQESKTLSILNALVERLYRPDTLKLSIEDELQL